MTESLFNYDPNIDNPVLVFKPFDYTDTDFYQYKLSLLSSGLVFNAVDQTASTTVIDAIHPQYQLPYNGQPYLIILGDQELSSERTVLVNDLKNARYERSETIRYSDGRIDSTVTTTLETSVNGSGILTDVLKDVIEKIIYNESNDPISKTTTTTVWQADRVNQQSIVERTDTYQKSRNESTIPLGNFTASSRSDETSLDNSTEFMVIINDAESIATIGIIQAESIESQWIPDTDTGTSIGKKIVERSGSEMITVGISGMIKAIPVITPGRVITHPSRFTGAVESIVLSQSGMQLKIKGMGG